jgi:hypothetical protein
MRKSKTLVSIGRKITRFRSTKTPGSSLRGARYSLDGVFF